MMKTKIIYKLVLTAICVMALSWFLPWLWQLIFPVAQSDPFIAYSPVSGELIVSDSDGESGLKIMAISPESDSVPRQITREERDSLLPQIYFNQLIGRRCMPDTIAGVAVTIPDLKHSQWVFSSIPRDVNRVMPEVYPLMESMPKRFDLEDPREVFCFRDGDMVMIDMASGEVDQDKTQRFSKVMHERGMQVPLRASNANITARKGYDEGYAIVDAGGDLYHVKMQAGRPYMARIVHPDSAEFVHAYIMENTDKRYIALAADEFDRLYAVEREGYRPVLIDAGEVDPRRDRITVFRNMFNWVVKVSDGDHSRWTVIDSDDHSALCRYEVNHEPETSERVARWIFPWVLTFTDIDDCYAYPRISQLSWYALILGAVLAIVVAVMDTRRRRKPSIIAVHALATLLFGIYYFITYLCVTDN